MEQRPWTKNYDDGVPDEVEIPDYPIFKFLELTAEKYPDKACTIFKGAEISYAEMNDLTDRLAAGFDSIGIGKGDRVGMYIPNTPQFVMVYYALLKLGAIVVATNPLYTEREIVHQANDSGMETMVLMTNNYEKVKAIQDQTKIKQIVATNLKEALPPILRFLFGLTKEKKGGFRVTLRDNDVWMQDLIATFKADDKPKTVVGMDDTALFQYSGGTTGPSKGVVATHRGLVANMYQLAAWNTTDVEGEEITLMAIPLFHAYGMVVGMNQGIMRASTLVMVPDPRNITDVLDTIQKYKATIFPGVPAMYNAINNHPDTIAGKYDLSSIKYCISGSAALLRETKETFEELTGGSLVEGYGLSEAPVATIANPLQGKNLPGSIGLPLPGVDCRVVDLDDEVTDLAQGEVGELLIRGPHVMKGYHNMPTETANALRDGWLYTGDIVYMDEEGYFFIVDRKKELIKPGGFQVWPREVEEVIQEHPKVMEVGVAGIPDAHSGEAVKAWIVLKDGEESSLEEIREYCKKHLAAYKVPKEVEFRDELPKSTVGKILRRELVRLHKESE
ncbi:MAG: long-chain fatty acid--CoA ligase [Chloroflexi bacterium]|nr:long-chain fatty acid--CoA ligase [Chloroflexota bacterium]